MGPFYFLFLALYFLVDGVLALFEKPPRGLPLPEAPPRNPPLAFPRWGFLICFRGGSAPSNLCEEGFLFEFLLALFESGLEAKP